MMKTVFTSILILASTLLLHRTQIKMHKDITNIMTKLDSLNQKSEEKSEEKSDEKDEKSEEKSDEKSQ